MLTKNENKWKKIIDNILIFNLFILIIGSLFFLICIVLTFYGNSSLFELFQKIWFPVFIPALSLFFTAILIEEIISRFINKNENN